VGTGRGDDALHRFSGYTSFRRAGRRDGQGTKHRLNATHGRLTVAEYH
jgi:hypothetical protein